MQARYRIVGVLLCCIGLAAASAGTDSAKDESPAGGGTKVYVPYKELKAVFEKEDQGVFLPYKDFQKLWRAAQGKPAGISEAPFEYLISTARFSGKVDAELGSLKLELTIDVLAEGWVQVPIGLGEVAVAEAKLLETEDAKTVPLLRVVEGQYVFVTKGKGRYVLSLDFVRQLETQPGLHVLKYRIPSAAITTLELLIPEENLKVDVKPMLAATTSQVKVDGANATKLQAFLGSAEEVSLSWKPKTQAAAELKPVVVCEQLQHINITEALISCEVKLDYSIHRGGVDSFTIRLPAEFRVTEVTGANILKWDVPPVDTNAPTSTGQLLNVKLFSPAKDKYTLTVRMERFLQEAKVQLLLVPIVTEQVLRRSGLVAITSSPRRSVHLEDLQNLARVDTGQLPEHLRNQQGVTAYRFITSDYGATIVTETALPRVTVDQRWALGVENDRLRLLGRVRYKVERTGVFELGLSFARNWRIVSVGPEELVDDYRKVADGDRSELRVFLKQEKMGQFDLVLTADIDLARPDGSLNFELPVPTAQARSVQSCRGQLMLLLPDQLQAEVEQTRQVQPIPLDQAEKWTQIGGLSPAMAFEYNFSDPVAGPGARFKIAVKPVQISATVHRLVNIQPGSIDQEAVIQYRIRYAPVDTLYLKMPAEVADAEVEITGTGIKETPRIDELPADQLAGEAAAEPNAVKWAYFKVVLQSKVVGSYQLNVRTHEPFRAGEAEKAAATVKVQPILAAGRLSDQNGHIAIAKSETLAIGEPAIENLIPADAGSAADLPYEPHRRLASLAFKYNAPPFELSLPVVAQKQAAVFTTIVSAAVIEQVLARDGMLNTHATYLMATSQGDRVPVTLPADAELTAVLLNGNEAPVETGTSANERIIRLPPSAGQVSRFTLEISYGLKAAKASGLQSPALPEKIPVQQTLWRLWIPEDYYLLGYDRVFSRIEPGRSQGMLRTLAAGQGSQVSFKLSGQGRVLDFLRQGPPGRLSVLLAGKGFFNIAVWVLTIAAGVLMLKLRGFQRVMIVLAVTLVGGIIHLYVPLLIEQIVRAGMFAAVLVLLLWAAHWVFTRVPQWRKNLPAKAAAKKPEKPQQAKTEPAGKPQRPETKEPEQSKQDEE
jgi:hypothetical protein